MSVKIKLISLIFLSIFAGLILFIILVICCSLLFYGSEMRSEESVVKYRYLSYNENLDDLSLGIVSLDGNFEGDFQYSLNEDQHMLISSFDNDQYVCYGSCYCQNDRRNAVPYATKGILYFLSAITPFIAYKLAREYFEEECFAKFSEEGECEKNKVVSSVDECAKVDEEPLKEEEETSPHQEKNFICEAECEGNPNLKKPENIEAAKSCGQIKKTGEVKVECTTGGGEQCEKKAKAEFVEKQVSGLCEEADVSSTTEKKVEKKKFWLNSKKKKKKKTKGVFRDEDQPGKSGKKSGFCVPGKLVKCQRGNLNIERKRKTKAKTRQF